MDNIEKYYLTIKYISYWVSGSWEAHNSSVQWKSYTCVVENKQSLQAY